MAITSDGLILCLDNRAPSSVCVLDAATGREVHRLTDRLTRPCALATAPSTGAVLVVDAESLHVVVFASPLADVATGLLGPFQDPVAVAVVDVNHPNTVLV